MDLGLKDKWALVTGASKNIGRGIALELAREGARVIAVARDGAALSTLLHDLPGGAGRHESHMMDLTVPGNPARLAQTLLDQHGMLPIVVHNLGGSLGVRETFSSADDWLRVWNLNVGTVIELNRVLVPAMVKAKWGRVVCLSTLATATFQGAAAYVAAKAALNAYVKIAGREVARHNVVMSAVSPGAIYTEGRHFAKISKENPAELEEYFRQHLPRYRLGTAEDVGRVAAFLASEHAGFMTGSIVGLDGGGM